MAGSVRGRGFSALAPVATARARFERVVPRGPLSTERVALGDAFGRVLAADLRAVAPVPPFSRSAMDGFAVRARDTFGASTTNPLALRLSGESRIGAQPRGLVAPGSCFRIATGAPLPPGADAVVMFERCREHKSGLVEVDLSATPGDNVSLKGEDVGKGERVMLAGEALFAEGIALAAALGFSWLRVARPPRVAVLSTGDELRPAGAKLRGGEIFDANGPGTLAAVRGAGGVGVDLGIARDSMATVRSKIRAGLRRADMLVVSGGTSVGARDVVPEVIAGLGRPGLVVHGVAMRPGYPVGLGALGRKPVVLLPGSPVAAALNVQEFVVPAIRRMLGEPETQFVRGATVRARATRRIPGAPGLTTYARVIVTRQGGELRAEPLAISGSGILSSLVRGSGLVIVPPAKEGVEEGEEVEVRLLRPLRSVSKGSREP
jgi:molybdenum cofactor synthesis domain-containing protein